MPEWKPGGTQRDGGREGIRGERRPNPGYRYGKKCHMRALCAAVVRDGARETGRVLSNTDGRPEGPVPGQLRARRQPPLPGGSCYLAPYASCRGAYPAVEITG